MILDHKDDNNICGNGQMIVTMSVFTVTTTTLTLRRRRRQS